VKRLAHPSWLIADAKCLESPHLQLNDNIQVFKSTLIDSVMNIESPDHTVCTNYTYLLGTKTEFLSQRLIPLRLGNLCNNKLLN